MSKFTNGDHSRWSNTRKGAWLLNSVEQREQLCYTDFWPSVEAIITDLLFVTDPSSDLHLGVNV